jgi:hypothetical protein
LTESASDSACEPFDPELEPLDLDLAFDADPDARFFAPDFFALVSAMATVLSYAFSLRDARRGWKRVLNE